MRKRSRPERRPRVSEPGSSGGTGHSTLNLPAAAFVRAYEAQLHERAEPRPLPWAGDEDVLADRHNIIHLLADLPSPRSASVGSLSSSWSVASDAEEAFELSGDEDVEAYKRSQRQKWVDGLRATRLAEREREDEEEAARVVAEEERKRDETPPADIAQLMTHTARSLAESPNPAMLVSRIMTRHASDARFTFLRSDGPYSSAWEKAKVNAGMVTTTVKSGSGSRKSGLGPAVKSNAKSGPAGLGLGGYGSGSDSGSDESGGSSGRHSTPTPPPPDDMPPPPPPGPPPPSPPPPPPP